MNVKQKLQEQLRTHLQVIEAAEAELCTVAVEIGREIAAVFRDGGKLFIFGNGGSAADAQHMAAEFINRYRLERPPLPAIALTTDSSTLTSIANDYEYRDVFAKQVRALADPGDIVMGISTSGTSDNIVQGLKAAQAIGCKTVALLGRTGGEAKSQADIMYITPHDDTARIQEVHLLLEHLICDYVEHVLFIEPQI
ncbi:phosphoheptose isomerase-like [Ylistrum balloti]|uniref:phosphoheptose isomerase-like n=1 Tax=Ylistrum balloti TaxID=509963 RepID=UPI002905B15C|nr:phosphoheptose isomerase-like [Ylistrum balloti]